MRFAAPTALLIASLSLGACGSPRPEGDTCKLVHTGGRPGFVGPIPNPRGKPPIQTPSAPNRQFRIPAPNAAFVRNLVDSLRTTMRMRSSRSYNLLAISAGGQIGAYGAGVLTGWKYSNVGRAPQFDMVTGVSTGALLAPLVFVGDDATAKLVYTTATDEDIYRPRSALELLTANSLVDTTPLQKKIHDTITDDFVGRIAAEGSKGRILAVQAVNLDLGDPIIFDLTAIAAHKSHPCGDDVSPRDCISAAMAASSAVPIGFSPVFIKGEMFVDGSLRNYVFTLQLINSILHHPEEAHRKAIVGGDFLLSVAGTPEPQSYNLDLTMVANTDFEYGITCTGNGILYIAGRSGGIAANELAEGSFFRSLTEIQSQPGNNAKLTFADPAMTGCQLPHVVSSGGVDSFDPKYMQCLYRQGCLMAFRGDPLWHFNPQDLPSPTVRPPGPASTRNLARPDAPAICRTDA
jgi:hypothetical protein